MSNSIYCAECGMRLSIFRKAMPTFNTVINIVEVHECSPGPIELDLKPDKAHIFTVHPKGKFAKRLEDLQPSPKFPLSSIDETGLRDRRDPKDVVHTDPIGSVPKGVLDAIDGLKDIK